MSLVNWDSHQASYINNGQAVHPPHTHPPVVRKPMPANWVPAQGERIITVERVAGSDRYETSVLINQLRDIENVEFAFLVNGTNQIDALPVAAAQLGPIFYVPPTGVAPLSVLNELFHLQPDVIIVIGGSTGISDQVVASVKVIRN